MNYICVQKCAYSRPPECSKLNCMQVERCTQLDSRLVKFHITFDLVKLLEPKLHAYFDWHSARQLCLFFPQRLCGKLSSNFQCLINVTHL